MDLGYWSDLSDAGAVLEMCFGKAAGQVGRVENPSDRERLAFFADFVNDNPESRHVLGQSTWTKTQLRKFGGYGYEHLLRRIEPALADRGVSAERIERMLRTEPVRLLDRDGARG
ncbi:hypothetical protein BH09ACT1_BH09ACT1_08740 [soil metagenome]